jgi:glutamate synthase (NADPH/NADH) small chain
MPDPRGFLKVQRVPMPERDPAERTRDFKEIFGTLPEEDLQRQGQRCMDCGVPFCNNGCPLGNLIPDWNDLVRTGQWRDAIDQLHATNNFPEFTGLICPAPCESACVLDINSDPVMIKQIEWGIIEKAYREGWVVPRPPENRRETSVGVVGSGPAGMAVAAELNYAGHSVTVYERDEAVGGLIRFGVPDHKLEKWIIDRRVAILEEEGVVFECNADVGGELSTEEIRGRHDALVIATGSRVERDLEIPGRDLTGVHYAMDYLYQRNRQVAREEGNPAREPEIEITAKGKHVVVVGGGDTGMDCVSNAHREGAETVVMYDVYSAPPPNGRYDDTPWPEQPRRSVTTYALDEGGERYFGHQVTEIIGKDGRVSEITGRQVQGRSSRELEAIPGTDFRHPCDLLLIAIGFTGPARDGLLTDLDLELSSRGSIKANTFLSSTDGVFACGDARVGQSLIVTAIADGRRCARVVDRWLTEKETPATVAAA